MYYIIDIQLKLKGVFVKPVILSVYLSCLNLMSKIKTKEMIASFFASVLACFDMYECLSYTNALDVDYYSADFNQIFAQGKCGSC